MPDSASSADAIAALSERWQRDKSSRLFLQLAEELRRAGRSSESLAVLEDGLQWHPDSVAGLVALGRCRLDLGRARDAVEPLERSLELDPAQLNANKLLAEAWIRLGDALQARARLDTYRLLNERDVDIDELAGRIDALETGGSLAATGSPPPRAIFDLEPLVERPPIELPAPVAPRSEWAPFAEIHRRVEAERLILGHLNGEGIFEIDARAVEPTPAAEPPMAAVDGAAPVGERAHDFGPGDSVEGRSAEAAGPEPWSPESEASAEPTAAPPPALFSLQSIGDEVERETIEEPLAAVVARAAESPPRGVGSSTLAALYLQQGHFDEAEAEFRAVLAARPGDDAALAGLVRLDQMRGAQPPSGAAAAPRPAGLTRRKIERLNAMLGLLRQARRSRADVP